MVLKARTHPRAEERGAMKTLLSLAIASVMFVAAAPAGAASGAARALAIVAPSAEQTLFDDEGALVISLAAVPPLEEGECIVVRVDQQVVILPGGLTKFALTGVPPGAHEIAAVIVDADANPVSTARALTFHIGAGSRI
jgi:hypothetical protein